MWGILFGCLFPLTACFFDLYRFNLPLTIDNLFIIHERTPMLYMIDTAPFFLGVFAFIAGKYKTSTDSYHHRLQQLIEDLEVVVSERTQELKVVNTNLQQSYLEAMAAAQAQGAFLANMSHEIRTPLNAVIGMATIAKKYLTQVEQNEKVGKSIDQILTSSRHLLGLINNILDLSKIRAGEFTLGLDNFSIEELVAECCQIIAPRCLEKKLTLATKLSNTENLWIHSDKLRIMQVLINLMGNSIKFTESGGTVTLEIIATEKTNDVIELYFAIHDTGNGMSEETIAILFQPFKQGSDDSVRKSGGTGLGLTISQNIVHLLKGEIAVTSTLGKGSTFFFSITVKKGVEEVIDHYNLPPPHFLRGKRILLVDDLEINRTIVEELLEDTDTELVMADDGHIAVETFTKSPLEHFDLILMDVQMPTMNGYLASQAIRALPRPDAKTIPIIALTANAMREDILAAKESGMNDHIVKPIELRNLLSVLNLYLTDVEKTVQ